MLQFTVQTLQTPYKEKLQCFRSISITLFWECDMEFRHPLSKRVTSLSALFFSHAFMHFEAGQVFKAPLSIKLIIACN